MGDNTVTTSTTPIKLSIIRNALKCIGRDGSTTEVKR